MDFVDYYKILGVDKTALAKDIKSAYRKLARKHHPDLNPNDKDAKKRFQQISEANEVLSDSDKRTKYDQYGKDWQHADEFEKQKKAQGHSSSNGQRSSQSHSGDDFSSFFESMFGNPKNRGRSQQTIYRGEDFNAELQLELIDAFKTTKKTLTVNGKNIRITIPAGIENGQTIKISGHGGKGINGGPNGDLYITFSIANHPKIKRLKQNLYTVADIDLYTAVLGGEITIDTLDGKVKLKVKSETQNESQVKLKGKGFPIYKNEGFFGDLLITFNVVVPRDLTDKQKELFTELSKL